MAERRRGEGDPRAAAVDIVERALAGRAPAGALAERAAAGLEPRDRALLYELALGTLRWLRLLDHTIVAASGRPLARIAPTLLGPLRVGAYQLLLLDRIPPHAAVDQAVRLARRLSPRGAAFVNAVLRRLAAAPRVADWPPITADPVSRLAIETSHPDFLVRRWLDRYGEERTRAMLAANNRPKPWHLLAFAGRGGREKLAAALAAEGIAAEPSPLAPEGLVVRGADPRSTIAFGEGLFYLQDEASQAAAVVPPPQPAELIFDAAAAPGGKGLALLASEPSARLVLADRAPDRLAVLVANLARLRLRLPLLLADAARPALAGGTFERVVLDLPCCGSGTLRKHPELKWRIGPAEIGRLAAQGLKLMRGVAGLVREEGLLAVITCSMEAEENEDVVARFLADERCFAPLPLAERLADPLAAGIAGPGRWRVFPSGDHDGFTVHVLRRERQRSR